MIADLSYFNARIVMITYHFFPKITSDLKVNGTQKNHHFLEWFFMPLHVVLIVYYYECFALNTTFWMSKIRPIANEKHRSSDFRSRKETNHAKKRAWNTDLENCVFPCVQNFSPNYNLVQRKKVLFCSSKTLFSVPGAIDLHWCEWEDNGHYDGRGGVHHWWHPQTQTLGVHTKLREEKPETVFAQKPRPGPSGSQARENHYQGPLQQVRF